ncbi:uncharacterized protein LOC116417687 [Nasonia vitripennis]|uniref:Uncharacterized protein n=1 Tax=Nasonia vitripennis TaxID=7425 RepID=A0A7M7QJT4_NASVI|nr:uncharacterized protein LOC116417687 [Nasonia vitripennis]
MEEFKKINWHPSIEDMIDNKFLNEERLQTEGAMYQIMNGVFEDPFQELRPRVSISFKADASKKTKTKINNDDNNKKKVVPRKRTKKKKNKKPQNKPTTPN